MVLHRERLMPGPLVFVAFLLVIPASLLVFLPINETVGVIVAIALYVGGSAALLLLAPTVSVNEEEITAGRASLPLEYVGDVSTYVRAEATAERGTRLDARAWLLLSGWVDPVAKITVTDENDPTPYWLVSTRRPADFASAIAKAKEAKQQKA